MSWTVHLGDSLAVLKTLPDSSVDAVVTDPPAGIAFMGRDWDKDKGGRAAWIEWMASIARECLRILKPGGHALIWALPRTSHWTATAWEDAGFEIRDRIAYIFGSGFPKSLDVSKAIDKMAGAEREKIGQGRGRTGAAAQPNGGSVHSDDNYQWPGEFDITAPATPAAQQWQGWGTALKPAMEDWWLARKPLGEGTVAANVLAWGVGGINVDGCRVEAIDGHTTARPVSVVRNTSTPFGEGLAMGGNGSPLGRWPANLVHDGSDEVVGLFPQSSTTGQRSEKSKAAEVDGTNWLCNNHQSTEYTDTGSAARFFYCAKASRREREAGCEGLEERDKYGPAGQWNSHDCFSGKTGDEAWRAKHPNTPTRNGHPTVKPIALMRWLCRLVTPPGGLVLDPFMGSGTTGCAAMLEGFNFVGIEREPEYIEIARRRITYWAEQAAAEREADEEDRQLRLLG